MDQKPDDFTELQTLLRLKKYEQPPAGYSERFLKEFHRRQRWETSQPRGLAAVWQSFNDWVATFSVPKYAYASTFGLFLMVALGINSFTGKPAVQNVASVSNTASAPVESHAASASFALNRPLDLSDLDVQSQLNPGSATASSESRPRYILDARPASYEAPFSF